MNDPCEKDDSPECQCSLYSQILLEFLKLISDHKRFIVLHFKYYLSSKQQNFRIIRITEILQ